MTGIGVGRVCGKQCASRCRGGLISEKPNDLQALHKDLLALEGLPLHIQPSLGQLLLQLGSSQLAGVDVNCQLIPVSIPGRGLIVVNALQGSLIRAFASINLESICVLGTGCLLWAGVGLSQLAALSFFLALCVSSCFGSSFLLGFFLGSFSGFKLLCRL